jgi:predicted  nucleic acid-binding Zn-ribbon protein
MDLLLELHDLEKTLGKARGKGKQEIQRRIDGICSRIDSWVLRHYRRHKNPFGEFRDRTCSACGMIYPKTHVHCRPDCAEFRLCEGCGRILLNTEDNQDGGKDSDGGEETASGEIPKRASKKRSPKRPKKK